jgi:NADH dehydrogenase (ubiquinone) Fe-S protein 1
MNSLIRFTVDDFEYSTFSGNTTLQASLAIGLDIPRFCYHEKLSIAGNCRMCLLEISYPRSLKPMASCALPVVSGMVVYTNTIMVKKSREGVLELLLLNHPLDCPICDQGGECDLQDETIRYGGDRGRFYESKRAVEDKELGPLIKTSMNRCIHCTKCVRFCNEVCGETILGTFGRGSGMEIGTYVDDFINSEFSGNLVDVCPVGALTSKPYAFKARPWELRSFETGDVMDSMGSRIRIDIRGTEVLRVLPSQSEEVNEEWITDRTRFSYDSLTKQRLHSPMLKLNDDTFVPVTWDTAFEFSSFFLDSFVSSIFGGEIYLNIFNNRKTNIFGFFGDLADTETLIILSDFFRELGSGSVFFQEKFNLNLDFRSSYLLNISPGFLEKIDLCIFIGINIRLELPLLNLRIRKAFLYNNALIISFGFLTNLTYQYFQQGNNLNFLFKFLHGKSYACKCLIESNFPVIFLGSSFLSTVSEYFFLDLFKNLNKYSNLITQTGWCGLNLLDSRISSVASKELGLGSQFSFGEVPCFAYFYGIDNLLNFNSFLNFFSFKIFHGHSGDINALNSDAVFPGLTFVEKENVYMTLEGRVQKTKFLLVGPTLSMIDWKIISSFRLFYFLDTERDFSFYHSPYGNEFFTIDNVRERLFQYSPSFNIPEQIFSENSYTYSQLVSPFSILKFFRIIFYSYNFLFSANSQNFFFNNILTQNSKIMSICANRFASRQVNF